MQFTKVQGLGNDFILVDGRHGGVIPDNPSRAAVLWCDRHFGIGADGLLLLLPSARADLSMRIFQPDGSEAEMCGNAIRCVALYLQQRVGTVSASLAIETLAGIKVASLLAGGLVRVDMGRPCLERGEIPMAGPPGRVLDEPLEAGGEVFRVTAVSMGNPHCLVYVPDVALVPVTTLGPLLEHHPAFPRRTNVEFIQVDDPENVVVRVWERGVGETLACGTGASAVAVGSFLNGFTRRSVKIKLAGGELDLEYNEDGRVYVTGPAAMVFTGQIAPIEEV
ncbi:MAG TPA: diaminopimelate epimerase [Spirochaetia bacterium]|nr:diaminopimelate epimerase [Spirochaetia bacterium]